MHTREMPTLSSVTYPEPDIVTLVDNSNHSAIPYGFGVQQPIVPSSLNDINLPPNPLYIFASMAVVHPNPTQLDHNFSPPVTGAFGINVHFNLTHDPEYN